MALTASQRVLYLKEIGRRLGEEAWPLIDITLSQFKLPTVNEWGADRVAYVMSMAGDASDSALTELAQHVERLKPPNEAIGVLPEPHGEDREGLAP